VGIIADFQPLKIMPLVDTLKNSPIGSLVRRWKVRRFGGSSRYWETRYAKGGNSGPGSYGDLALFKADVLNRLVAENGIDSVVELGCGDGHQLSLAAYPRYVGVDVSPTALKMCREAFAGDASKRFAETPERAEMAISLDVILHLVEDDVFDAYMRDLFQSATRLVVIFSEDVGDQRPWSHVRYRDWRTWVATNIPAWREVRMITNPHKGSESVADFFIYEPQ
jgi:SAM-dependent methyltransferase